MSATARPISFEAPSMSPLAYLKCFLAISDIKHPPITAAAIPKIPTKFRAK